MPSHDSANSSIANGPLFPLEDSARCPCGTGLSYGECCAKYHRGQPAPTALTLMRSRFSAFVTGDEAYLLASWDPETRPQSLDFSAHDEVKFYRLDILNTVNGGAQDSSGIVEFEAFYKGSVTGSQHERSAFRRAKDEHGVLRWFYTAEI